MYILSQEKYFSQKKVSIFSSCRGYYIFLYAKNRSHKFMAQSKCNAHIRSRKIHSKIAGYYRLLFLVVTMHSGMVSTSIRGNHVYVYQKWAEKTEATN